MRPMSLDSVTWAPGSAFSKIAPAWASNSVLTGLKTEVIATERMPLALMSAAMPMQFGFVERRNHAAVEFMAAMGEIRVIADRAPQVFGPIDHRRQRGGRRQAEAHGGGRREIAALHHRIGEMGRADHDDVDRFRLHSGGREHGFERRHHARTSRPASSAP